MFPANDDCYRHVPAPLITGRSGNFCSLTHLMRARALFLSVVTVEVNALRVRGSSGDSWRWKPSLLPSLPPSFRPPLSGNFPPSLPRAAHTEPMLALFAGRRRRNALLQLSFVLVGAPEDDQQLSKAEAALPPTPPTPPPLRHPSPHATARVSLVATRDRTHV